jgi:hypothetical protein
LASAGESSEDMIEIDCIGALAVATAVLSYRFYQERQKTTGVEISVGERGISIEKK